MVIPEEPPDFTEFIIQPTRRGSNIDVNVLAFTSSEEALMKGDATRSGVWTEMGVKGKVCAGGLGVMRLEVKRVGGQGAGRLGHLGLVLQRNCLCWK